jgi:hypothetical protein
MFTVLGDKLRLLVGKTPLNKIMDEHKYNLEGLTGTYASMPKPTEDNITADHQPQAAIIISASKMKIFAGTKMKDHAAGRAAAGYAINLHAVRHEAGRTYSNKGKETLTEFETEAEKIASNNSLKDDKKRKDVVKLLKSHLNKDVSKMKEVAGKKSNYTDLDELGLEDDEVEGLRKTIKAQILSGEGVLQSQNLDDLVN